VSCSCPRGSRAWEDHLVPNRAESRVPARYRSALLLTLTAIAFELLALAGIRQQFFGTGFLSSFVSVTPGGGDHRHDQRRAGLRSADRRPRFSQNPQKGRRPSGHMKT
jgi:hypothetical protein